MMEGNLLKSDTFTAEYRFATDLVSAVIEMRTIYVPNSSNIELDSTFFTGLQSYKIKEIFKKEWPKLDKHVRRFTNRDGRLDFSDGQFLLCVVQFIEEYKHELKSEEEFLLVCSRIAYVAACFLRNNDQSDAVSVAVDRVFEILIDTYFPSLINKDGPLIKNVRDPNYRLSYDLVKTLIERRGVLVPDLELPNADHCLFTANHRIKVKELFFKEWSDLDKLIKSIICKKGTYGYSDENLSRCFDEILERFGSAQNTEDFVLVCARIAYASAMFLRESSESNAKNIAVNRIHQMVKESIYFSKYDQDDEYRFSCDLIKVIFKIRSDLHSDNSLFMIAHRNKIEDFLLKHHSKLDKIMQKYTIEDESLYDNDSQFVLCMYQILDDYKLVNKSKEEMVYICTKIAYVAACFLRRNNMSNAPELALNHMLEIVKDIKRLPHSEDEKVLIMKTRDDHYRFSYDLVKSVLEMKEITILEVNLPEPDNYLFTETHRNDIEKLLLDELSQLDTEIESLINESRILDHSDSNFIRCMNEIVKKYYNDQKTEEGLVYIGAIIAYLSAYFFKENYKSNAIFLAANRIYEMIKNVDCFSNTKEEMALIFKTQDKHYRFAYDLTRTVFEIKGIPVSAIDLPDSDNILFTETLRNSVKDMVSKEWFWLDEMVESLRKRVKHFDYSDSKFLYCMNQIVQDYQSDQKIDEEFVYVCARIAYIAAVFLIKNYRSNATFLAVNRMYEMTKDSFFNNTEEEKDVRKETYHFAYDLVRAALKMGNDSSLKVEHSDLGDSPLTIQNRHEVHIFLSNKWPRLHQLVRKFTRNCADTAFCDGHFSHCMQKITNDFGQVLKSEKGLLHFNAMIAYVATCFLEKNQNSKAADLALDQIYQMRREFYRFKDSTETNSSEKEEAKPSKKGKAETISGVQVKSCSEENSFVLVVLDDKHRLAYDLVKEVMKAMKNEELMPDAQLPYSNILFTSKNRKTIKKLFKRKSKELIKLLENITETDGKSDYSDGNFQHCMDKIFEDYKHEQANKEEFVRLCARVAYPAFHFVNTNKASNAIILAVNRVYEMARNSGYFNKDVRDEKYRFAYDLVKAVVEIEGIQIPNTHLPNPKRFLFKTKHKLMIEDFLSKETQLDDPMRKFTCKNESLDYSDKSFTECMGHIIKDFTPEDYTEEGFILLCGRIAYAAAGYLKNFNTSNATRLAVNQIHEMAKNAFSNGTLSKSSR